MSAPPFGCNLIRSPNAGGRTLLENWVEDRLNRSSDGEVSTSVELKNGHKNLITGEKADHQFLTTTADYYKQPDSRPKEAQAGVLTRKRYQDALQEVLDEERAEEMRKQEEERQRLEARRANPRIPTQPGPPQFDSSCLNEKPITVWSQLHEAYKTATKGQIVGGTAGEEFKRSAKFSTPLVHQLDKQDDIPYQL
ncbi:Oidioi.mRNA.OKI2018_I69.XSR.g14385.t1.cds [Oikopleura dioica]|uniref:Oidioi.mRNA.OKI2018_I69.XSR.g14385.t1.cds n=1 Tax=Oikopleura dioica TaxID=34765 RepID=A0ABN7S9L9_OIKDI|nr:Oidioi.mRNA.OKI2018_I69.XSR.g14385.t1.cds [Oikopleura dioica]